MPRILALKLLFFFSLFSFSDQVDADQSFEPWFEMRYRAELLAKDDNLDPDLQHWVRTSFPSDIETDLANEPHLRREAIRKLGLSENPIIVPALVNGLRDPVWQVRFESVAALSRFNPDALLFLYDQVKIERNENVLRLIQNTIMPFLSEELARKAMHWMIESAPDKVNRGRAQNILADHEKRTIFEEEFRQKSSDEQLRLASEAFHSDKKPAWQIHIYIRILRKHPQAEAAWSIIDTGLRGKYAASVAAELVRFAHPRDVELLIRNISSNWRPILSALDQAVLTGAEVPKTTLIPDELLEKVIEIFPQTNLRIGARALLWSGSSRAVDLVYESLKSSTGAKRVSLSSFKGLHRRRAFSAVLNHLAVISTDDSIYADLPFIGDLADCENYLESTSPKPSFVKAAASIYGSPRLIEAAKRLAKTTKMDDPVDWYLSVLHLTSNPSSFNEVLQLSTDPSVLHKDYEKVVRTMIALDLERTIYYQVLENFIKHPQYPKGKQLHEHIFGANADYESIDEALDFFSEAQNIDPSIILEVRKLQLRIRTIQQHEIEFESEWLQWRINRLESTP